MQKKFDVETVSFKKITTAKGAWGSGDYQALLGLMGLEERLKGASADELKEMCLMSLSDFEPAAAARFVLTHLLPAADFTEGKIDQLSHEMQEDRLWEEFPDCLFHYTFFNAYGLLRAAFNGVFAEPTGVDITVRITAEQESDFSLFEQSPQATLLRLLAGGMDDNAILNRLYDEQISGASFPAAPGIIWNMREVSQSGLTRDYNLLSSAFWLEPLEQSNAFQAITHADIEEEED